MKKINACRYNGILPLDIKDNLENNGYKIYGVSKIENQEYISRYEYANNSIITSYDFKTPVKINDIEMQYNIKIIWVTLGELLYS